MLYQVYIIENPTKKRYIGLSEDISVRIQQHNQGVSKWTKGKGPWTLIWSSPEINLTDARKLENKLKRQGRGSGFYSITGLKKPKSS